MYAGATRSRVEVGILYTSWLYSEVAADFRENGDIEGSLSEPSGTLID